MNLFKLANILDKKISPLRMEPNLCTQNISPKSSCRSCLDACPADSMTIENRQIKIDDTCMECGICSTVCPTNAILFEHPSLSQLLDEITRKCKNEEHVYLQCGQQATKAHHTATVKVPCLGAIPKEAWMVILNKHDNLSIYHAENSCHSCEIATGYAVWQNELFMAESMTKKNATITSTIQKKKKQAQYDTSRRELFSLFADEFKSTNKLVIKEVLGEKKIASYQEKLQEDTLTKVRKEWENVSTSIVEKLTNEAALPFMSKRKLFLEALETDAPLQNRCDIRLPSISTECNFCGACSLLCPTDALTTEMVDSQKIITLQPYKCVDCHLCEEICYLEHIQLKTAPNKQLFQESVILATEPQ